MKSQVIQNIKTDLKQLAQSIRDTKFIRKPINNKENLPAWKVAMTLNQYQYKFRHMHIAYCILRGRTYAQIENPEENNKPNMKKVDEYLVAFKKLLANEQPNKEERGV